MLNGLVVAEKENVGHAIPAPDDSLAGA